MLNFLFEVGHEVRVYRNSVTISFRIFWWKIASCENVLFEGKNTGQVCFRGQMISLLSLYKVVEPYRYTYHVYILEINKQINRTSSVEISSAKTRATNNIAPALYLAIPVQWAPLLYQHGYFKSSTKWGKACFCIDPERDGAPVAGETLIKNSHPWPNNKSQVRGIQVGTVIAILKTCNIWLN